MLDAGLGRVLTKPPFSAASTSSTTQAHKSARRDANVKRDFPHIYPTRAPTAWRSTRVRRGGSRGGHRRGHLSIDAPQATTSLLPRGRLDRHRNLRAMAAEKRAAGRDVPVLNWRYILFEWNDSDEEMQRARDLAAEIGVDRLAWEITDHPEEAFSRRFAPGTAEHQRIRHEIWDTSNLGNAIPGATPRARIEVAPMVPGLPLFARRGRLFAVRTRVHNLSTRPFPREASYGRRLVPSAPCDASGIVLDRDHAGRGCHAQSAASRCRTISAGRRSPTTSLGSTWSAKASTGSKPAD